MNKSCLPLLAFLTILSFIPKAYSQNLNGSYYTDSCIGPGVYVYMDTGAFNVSNYTLNTYWGDGTSSTATPYLNKNVFYQYHPYTTQGTYTIKYILLLNNTPVDSMQETFNAYCSRIFTRYALDTNSDCKADFYLSSYYGRFEIDSAGTIIDTGYSHSSIFTDPGVQYNLRALDTPLGTKYTCPSTGIITTTGPARNNYILEPFLLEPDPSSAFDLSIYTANKFLLYNNGYRRNAITIYVSNKSYIPQSATVTLQLSNKLKFISSIPAASNISGNIIQWTVNNLSFGNGQIISLSLDTATTLTINDTICNTATITPTSGDINITNNTYSKCSPISASWDPNNKIVDPSGVIMPGTKLSYTINFENLGSDTAYNIYILDTLSQHLNTTSIEITDASHSFIYQLINNNIIRFDFADIKLPDSTSPLYNKGYISYNINAKQALAPNTNINNRAGIYFDINPVVLTNTTENIVGPLSITSINNSDDIKLYPNPTSETITLETDANTFDSYKVYNSIGQYITGNTISQSTENISMKGLPSGMYYIQITGKEKAVTKSIRKL